ncbi:MAG: DUF1080 domain-containing protein [Armatimonadetes bacterium]|nr:DUF1080 domain-containing protein [Armatimonadota bacterium]
MTAIIVLAALVSVQEPEPFSLFDGKSLKGWHQDIPDNDGKDSPVDAFTVRDGVLVSLGQPFGHLITDAQYENYKLVVEYRYSKEAGNCGVIVHVSIPRFRSFLPQGVECQLRSGSAGDFFLFGETICRRSAPDEPLGRVPNMTDDSENEVGEWNTMVIECRGDEIKVWMNGDLVNDGVGCSVSKGQIALQSEGAEVEFRKLEMTKLSG